MSGNGASNRSTEVGVVNRGRAIMRAEVHYFVTEFLHKVRNHLFQGKASVVCTEGQEHEATVATEAGQLGGSCYGRVTKCPQVGFSTMALDPRTPVLVGVGQVTTPPEATKVPVDRPQPLDLMVRAIQAAAEDCDGVGPGSIARSGRALLERAQRLAVIASFGWHTSNPGALIAERLSIDPAELILTTTGGNTPLQLLHASARKIAAGELDVAIVTGAEAMYTRALARRSVEHGTLTWASQAAESTPQAVSFGSPDRSPVTDLEGARGVHMPIQAYPLLENAIRSARGWTLEEHKNAIGDLWAIGAQVAAGNPYAWIKEPMSSEEIMTPTASNRMVSYPYTKYTVANLSVDQGAAYILCSVEAARAAGVSDDRFVFPLAGADGNDHWFLSHRENLHSSPAIRLAGEATFAGAEVLADELAFVDLYSCFPAVVQIAIEELGLGSRPERPWTTTGGLVFAGGPGNNYVTHSIASMVEKLRAQPGASGLVTGLGWFSTKHSVGIFGSRPPRHQGADGYRWTDVQQAVDASPQTRVDSNYVGTCTVETSTVTFNRTGDPEHGIVVARTDDNARVWGQVTHADHLKALLEVDPNGRSGSLAADGTFTLS